MNKNKQNIRKILYGVALFAVLVVATITGAIVQPRLSSAASNTNLSQAINAGALATDIKNASRASVASPSVTMSTSPFPFICLVGADRPSGTFGSNTERIYIENPGQANNGWTLTLAATGGATSLWQNGGSTQNYDFNDPTGTDPGCDDGADADARAGQLSVDPSVSTLTPDCDTCTTANITKGSATAYSQGVTDSITLLNAALASDDFGRWYLTGVDMDQTIPENQAADSYTLNLTLTVTAL